MSAAATPSTTSTSHPDPTQAPTINLTIQSIQQSPLSPKITIASVGCVHGELDAMYLACHQHQQRTGEEIHIVVCCGDFESLRNYNDLQCLAAPPKYREMVDFYKYYNGKSIAPILTIFTHGNHEASNYLMELPYGGWVAPNVYFMGFTNVINFFGIAIAAIGGIFKPSYTQSRHESCPMDNSDQRSLYHTREVDTWMLSQYSKPIDIILSHDWPTIVTQDKNGDVNRLGELKPLFIPEIKQNALGSPHHSKLLQRLRPLYWFSAHLHCKYPALITHATTSTIKTIKPVTDGEEVEIVVPVNTHTKFLGLDKILPNRHFMHIFTHPIGPSSVIQQVPHRVEQKQQQQPALSPNSSLLLDNFFYDPFWIDILQSTQPSYPRARGSSLVIRSPIEYKIDANGDDSKKKQQHGNFYSQFNGVMCNCITTSSTRDDLFIAPDDMVKLLYPEAVYDNESFHVPSFAFEQTAAPLLTHTAPPKNHNKQQQRGNPIIVADIPSFQLNPQTVMFCNRFKLMVPVFDGKTQWCSPKHAAALYLAQKKKDRTEKSQ